MDDIERNVRWGHLRSAPHARRELVIDVLRVRGAPPEASSQASLGVRFGIAALRGGDVQFLLNLFETDPNSLLMEVPDVPVQRCIDLSQFLELTVEIGDPICQFPMRFIGFIETLIEAFGALFEAVPDLLEA